MLQRSERCSPTSILSPSDLDNNPWRRRKLWPTLGGRQKLRGPSQVLSLLLQLPRPPNLVCPPPSWFLSTQALMTEPSDSLPGSKASSPTDQTKSQIDFQFLNFSHPSDAKGSRARRTVRSHVTKQQHQKEHAAAAARRAKSYPQPDGPPEADDLPTSRPHAATFPPERPALTLPEGPTSIISQEDIVSPSPSPTGSSPMATDQQIDPREVYPADWHPYLPKILVR